MEEDTITLYRPTGPRELELLKESGFRRWPPRLPGQPIFYPVTNESYAAEIASKWNVRESGSGYVTRFRVRRSFIERYERYRVGASLHEEWWIPAENLTELNENIVGLIEVVQSFGQAAQAPALISEDAALASFVSRFGESDSGRIAFAWNGKHGSEFHDANHEFRTAVTEYVLRNPGEAPIDLLRALFKAHAECSVEAWGAPLDFGDLGATLLSRGGPDVLDDFASGFVACFDTYGACHQMLIDPVALRSLSQHVRAELAQEPSEERRRKLEAVHELFGKLSDGTAGQGWAVLQPGTEVQNIRVVGRGRLAWLRLKRSLRRLFASRRAAGSEVDSLQDLTNPKWMYLKAALLLVILLCSGGLLLSDRPTWRTAALLALVVWASARLYYFIFYVIERYIDSSYRFSGVASALRYVFRRSTHEERTPPGNRQI